MATPLEFILFCDVKGLVEDYDGRDYWDGSEESVDLDEELGAVYDVIVRWNW